MPNWSLRTLVRVDATRIALIALGYLLVSELALLFPAHPRLTGVIGFPCGLSLGVLLLRPRREWRAILAAILLPAIAVNLQSGYPFLASAGLAAAGVAEALTCAWAMTRVCGPDVQFFRVGEILALTGFSAVVSGAGALLGAGIVAFAGGRPSLGLWLARWAADGLGMLLIAPLVVVWIKPQARLPGQPWKRAIEWALAVALSCGAAWYALQFVESSRLWSAAPCVLVAMLAWPALRFGPRGVTLTLFLLVAVAGAGGWGTSGPPLWAGEREASHLLAVQVHLICAAAASLFLAAGYAEVKSADRRSREHEFRMRRVLEETDAGFFRIGLDGRFQMVNQGWLRMHGFTHESEVIGMPFAVTQVPEDQAPAAEYAAKLARGERVRAGEFSRLCRDGSVGYHTFSAGPVTEDGKIVGFEGFLIDITGRKRSEEELRRANAELHQVSADLISSQDDERRRIALELHDGTAQLLAALAMNLTLLQESDLSHELSQELFEESDRLCAQCSTEIRTLSFLLHPPLFDELGLGPAIEEYAAGFTSRTGIRVQTKISPQSDRLPMGTARPLFRIVQESLANVFRHAGASEVEISLWLDERSVTLEVADNGIGIPANLFTSHTATGARMGVGLLGMRERARQLGGDMKLESNGGARIVVNLPIGEPT